MGKYQGADGKFYTSSLPQAEAEARAGQKLIPVQDTTGMGLGEKAWKLGESAERGLAGMIGSIPNKLGWLLTHGSAVDSFEGPRYDESAAGGGPLSDMEKSYGALPSRKMTPEYETYNTQRIAEQDASPVYQASEKYLPTSHDVRSGIASLFDSPETLGTSKGEQLYQKAVQGVTMGAATGGVGGLAAAAEGGAAGLTSVLGGEGARELGAPEPLAVAVEMLAGGAPALARSGVGAASNLVRASQPSAARLMRNAVEGGGDLAQATAFVNTARALGHTVTLDEAMNWLSNGGAQMLTALRQSIGQAPGADALRTAAAARPAQAATEVNRLAQNLETAPLTPGGPRIPAMTDAETRTLGTRATQGTIQAPGAAKEAVDAAKDWRTAQSAESYGVSDAALPIQGPQDLDAWMELLNRPDLRRAWDAARRTTADTGGPGSVTFRNDPLTNAPTLETVRVPNGAEVDAMKYDIDRVINRMQASGDFKGAIPFVQIKQALTEFGDARIPMYAQARAESGAAAEAIQPVLGSEVGAMAKMKGTPEKLFAKAVKELFPNNPKITGEESSADLLRLLRGDPQTTAFRPGGYNVRSPGGGSRALRPEAQQLVAKYLEGELSAAAGAGKNPLRLGEEFNNLVMGNPAQRANVIAKVRAISEDAADRLERVSDIFEAQGFMPEPGSPTAFKTEVNTTLKNASPAQAALDTAQAGAALAGGNTAAATATAGRGFRQMLQERALRLNSAQLAEWLLNPNLSRQWQQLARQRPGSEQAARLLAAIMPSLAPGTPGAR